MRLTLRTLLAYLDDTLDPTEIKQIGQKVAESDAAQELIARIKQVTRRRRLTTPPPAGTSGKTFDSNTVAEYLDNELDSDQLAEIEKICLDSDVHLAEIAACHQILTLVLGEPALVPPTARERMYGLVKGREAIPFRKATVPAAASGSPTGEDDDDVLGLPFRRQGVWMMWAVPVAAVCLVAVIGFALWRAVANPADPRLAGGGRASLRPTEGKDGGRVPDDNGAKTTEPTPMPDDKGKLTEPTPMPDDKGKDKGKSPEPPMPMPEPTRPPMPPAGAEPKLVERTPQPSAERRDVGVYQSVAGGLPSMLVAKPRENGAWRRLSPGSKIASSDQLVSLPGCPSELRLDSGVRLQLWGQLNEFTNSPFILESAVSLHAQPGLDLEFTLERGRVYILNGKSAGPAQVRIRFDKEIWDLTLQEPGSEVAIDYMKQYTSDIKWMEGEEPRAELYLCINRGKASLKVDTYHVYSDLTAPPGPAFFTWDNKGAGTRGPINLPMPLPVWSKEPLPPGNEQAARAAQEMRLALEELSKQMVGKPAEVVLVEGIQPDRRPALRTLCLLSLGAIDDVPKLLDVLADEDPRQAHDRNVAIFALRRWINRNAANGRSLYDPRMRTGLLMDKKYKPDEANTILELLNQLTETQRREAGMYEYLINLLRSDRIAIRELAYWWLDKMSEGTRLPRYNPSMPPAERDAAATEFLKLVKDGRLPPPPPAPQPPQPRQ